MTTYGCEVWKLKEKNKTKVKSHRDGLLEESARKSRLERVTNESEKYGSYIYNNRRTLNLYGTGKNAENQNIEISHRMVSMGEEKTGGPGKSWQAGINKMMKERNL